MAAAAAARALVFGLLVSASRSLGEDSCFGEETCQAVAEEEVAELATPLLQTGKTRQTQPPAGTGGAARAQPAAEPAALLAASASGEASAERSCITKNCVCDDSVTCCFGTHCRNGWGGVMRCLFDSDPTDVEEQDPEKCVCDPPAGYGMGILNSNASGA
mmetsp:Transcript_70684/g.187538  ORF Transcript_70684/g.187538 Transcript_70684/m.187538 type:complete len:160 (+) Transcript_70684:72-551(+)